MGWPSGFKRFFTGVVAAVQTEVVAARTARPSAAAPRKALRGGIERAPEDGRAPVVAGSHLPSCLALGVAGPPGGAEVSCSKGFARGVPSPLRPGNRPPFNTCI